MKNKAYILSLIILYTQLLFPKPPKLTIVFVVDQLSANIFNELKSNNLFESGIKQLSDEGHSYIGYFPHAVPTTATGHTCLNTGALPRDHGIIGNKWYDSFGIETKAYHDDSPSALTFNPHKGTYDYGASAKNVMVSGLSDMLIGSRKYDMYSISLKDRAAIGLSGINGKAIWMDRKTYKFTTSKAFFQHLPDWLRKFNKKIWAKKTLSWNLKLPKDSHKYKVLEKFTYPGRLSNYGFSSDPPMAGKKFSIESKETSYSNDRYLKTPQASKQLFACAKQCLEKNLNHKRNLVIAISASNLDLIGHIYGPTSLEAIDWLLHLDQEIGDFIKFAKTKISEGNTLYIFTSDHGAMPIPELIKGKGAKRINTNQLVSELNTFIERKYKIKNIVMKYSGSGFYLDTNSLGSDPNDNKIMKAIVKFLKSKNYIKNAWTSREISLLKFPENSPESFVQTQIYPGRSPQIVILPKLFVQITSKLTGTDHCSPYSYDTHVPLIIHGKKYAASGKTSSNKVIMTRFAATMAKLLGVPKPPKCNPKPIPVF